MSEKENNLTIKQVNCNDKDFQAHVNFQLKNNKFSKSGQLKLEKILSSKFDCFDSYSKDQEVKSFGNLMKIKAKSTLKNQNEKDMLKNLHFKEIKDEISYRKKFKSIVLNVNNKNTTINTCLYSNSLIN